MDLLKNKRRYKKTAVTLAITALNKLIQSEANIDDVSGSLDKLNVVFDQFEDAHNAYHKELTDEEECEASNCYFIEMSEKHVDIIAASKRYVNAATRNGDNNLQLAQLMSLPKMDIEQFDGNPLKFHAFMLAFDDCVDKVTEAGSNKLIRLFQFTTGVAKESIRPCLMIGGMEGYNQARHVLKDRYGNNHLVANRVTYGLRNGKPAHTPTQLLQLADELKNGRMILKGINYYEEVDTQHTILEIVNRVPSYAKQRWKTYAVQYNYDNGLYPGLDELETFIIKISNEANDPIYGEPSVVGERCFQRRVEKPASAFVTTADHTLGCVVCNGQHKVVCCPRFNNMTVNDRLRVVAENNLCENCFLGNHTVFKCYRSSYCNIDGCRIKHNRLVHVDAIVNNYDSNIGEIYMPVVSVIVNDKLNVHALLDTASTSSFCTRRIVDKLCLNGVPISYNLRTLTSGCSIKSQLVNLQLKSHDHNILMISCFVVDNIPVQTPVLDKDKYPHLRGIDVTTSVDVDILIGQDNAEALVPLDVRRGRSGEPFATKTMFGWSINGPSIRRRHGKNVVANFIKSSIDERLDRLWEIDDDGINGDTVGMSVQDEHVLRLWNDKGRFINGHMELPIPWRFECVSLPNNLHVARSRLNSLTKSLTARGIYSTYDKEIEKLLINKYAEPVSSKYLQGRVWYLPHHAVPKKNGQFRIVFDCASVHHGVSLNSSCLQGPDFNNRLLHILLRFRQYKYAIMADIEAMYHQIKIPDYDRDALRFLWYNSENEVQQYRMTSHVFGGVWCASSSAYALRKVAESDECTDETRDTILRSFYVDDCLKSCKTVTETRSVISETRDILKKNGFKLTKFVVNDDDILDHIPADQRAKDINKLSFSTANKALGVKWCVESDTFYFETHFKLSLNVTKRIILQFISSIFDPLGLINPIVVNGKMLFQESTRLKLDWDAKLPDQLCANWNTWLNSLLSLNTIKVRRCLISERFNDAVCELHMFSDASERAYGVCAYVRCINSHGEVCSRLILSKSKLSPKKCTTIPRLELEAAVLSVKTASVLIKELDIPMLKEYYWVDSEIVLKYIKNEDKRFHVYVSNRVSAIRKSTDPERWFHVPGCNNPADIVSRGCSVSDLNKTMWFEGPKFLKAYKNEWKRTRVRDDISPNDPEVKSSTIMSVHLLVEGIEHPIDTIVNYFSSWYKVKRITAWFLKCIDARIHKRKVITKLSPADLQYAELIIVKFIQNRWYEMEINYLKGGKAVQKSSTLLKLMPMLNKDGVLVVGGRIKHANIDQLHMHPIILPRDHPAVELIVKEFHCRAHLGREWVLSDLRCRFWIVSARYIVERVARKCIVCRKLFGLPCGQKMADLPSCRLNYDEPPFTDVGVDCFGPFHVKYGRAEVKRYGCLFTCMTTRAVHIETLCNLESSTFINGFRRFVSRRGTPKRVWSDNGTNFIGAKSEITHMNSDLRINALKDGIEWIFNPPGASHMGGVWERMIRTIRRVLAGVLHPRCRLTDDILNTVLCEVESIINNRPLTKLSNDINDCLPLTPNHLLCVKNGVSAPSGCFSQQDVYKGRWKYVQHLTEQFWRRWLREYLPTLQMRNKWTKVKRCVSVGDLVLIAEEITPRHVWPLGLVIHVNKGRDGLVRSVRLKTKSSVLVRPITKVVLLEESG